MDDLAEQRAIYTLAPEQRGRISAIDIAIFFAGGSIVSAVAAWCFVSHGWWAVAAVGVALPLVALVYSFCERTKINRVCLDS